MTENTNTTNQDEQFYEYLFKLRSSGFLHHSPEFEQRFFSNISAGDRMMFEHLLSKMDGDLGILSNDDNRNGYNLIVGMNFLLCRQAINHQVDSELAFSVSDYYINQLANIHDGKGQLDLINRMMYHYYELMNKNQALEYCLPVNRCILYIRRNLYSKISVADIANYLNLSPSYLSTLFRKETGYTLNHYIHKAKIDEAKLMIAHTTNTITQIALSLGYSSPAHFSKVFLSLEGVPPKQYHAKIKL